jgi:hypothetical protein
VGSGGAVGGGVFYRCAVDSRWWQWAGWRRRWRWRRQHWRRVQERLHLRNGLLGIPTNPIGQSTARSADRRASNDAQKARWRKGQQQLELTWTEELQLSVYNSSRRGAASAWSWGLGPEPPSSQISPAIAPFSSSAPPLFFSLSLWGRGGLIRCYRRQVLIMGKSAPWCSCLAP